MSDKLKKIISGGLEVLKDSAEQLGKTVSANELLNQAFGIKKENEFAEFLKKSGPDLSEDELEKKKKEFEEKKEKDLAETRQKLQTTLPSHMQIAAKPPPLRSYDQNIEEAKQHEEAINQAKENTHAPVITPSGKPQKGSAFARNKQPKGIEGFVKDTKIG